MTARVGRDRRPVTSTGWSNGQLQFRRLFSRLFLTAKQAKPPDEEAQDLGRRWNHGYRGQQGHGVRFGPQDVRQQATSPATATNNPTELQAARRHRRSSKDSSARLAARTLDSNARRPRTTSTLDAASARDRPAARRSRRYRPRRLMHTRRFASAQSQHLRTRPRPKHQDRASRCKRSTCTRPAHPAPTSKRTLASSRTGPPTGTR